MGVVSIVICDLCGNAIDSGARTTVVYNGTLGGTTEGKALIQFATAEEATPQHHHEECHVRTHSASPSEEKGLVH